MDNASGHTINLANSIIGVGILAMPYCFRQCGILLSIFLLLISSIISRLACHFLLKSAIIARRKTFEFLAFHIFGSLGKFSIEIGMIGFLLGTCIAFFVVMGDLAPAILSEMTGVKIGSALRNSTLVALAVFCVLPLGLLRNVDSLNVVSTATIGFYCFLVLKIIIEALPHIFTGDWVSEVVLWQPAGILQCLPIFSMALFCQTQLFEIYQAIPNASLEKMNSMIRVAVNMCTWVYIFVGAFGYIAFFQKNFAGNILLSFHPSLTSNGIKMGFVLSLAFSFPLVIFPCRASLYSLLYKGTSYTNLHEGGATNYIPEGKFKMLTLIVVSVSLVIGIMIPNIELVLGLIGSTIGVMICVLFPVTCFICISPKNTNERILAQIMLFVGVIVMVLGTYANLQAINHVNLEPVTEKVAVAPPEIPIVKTNDKPIAMNIPTTLKVLVEKLEAPDPPHSSEKLNKVENPKEVRHEPPQPVEPVDNSETKTKVVKKVEEKPIIKSLQLEEDKPKIKKTDEVDIEAIQKEERELKEDEEKKDSNQLLIDTIKKQNEEIVKEQKKLIEVIKKQQETVNVDKVKEEQVKAVKQIEDIAKRAIESISGQDKKDDEDKSQKIIEKETNKSQITEDEKIETKTVNLVPLPLALAKLNNVTLDTPKQQERNVSATTTDDVKSMRREILSDGLKARQKRDVSDVKMENLTKAVKEVCDEINKSPSTEKPVIKMLCKLSDSNVNNVPLNDFQKSNLLELQGRDFKQLSKK